MLLITRLLLCVRKSGGGSRWKQIKTTVTLSVASRLIDSSTNSLQQSFTSLCSCNLRRMKSTAFWLEKTSQIPSLPIIKNSSSFVRVINLSSGSALRGPGLAPSEQSDWYWFFMPSRCQSPRARVTANCPLRYPSSMKPPRVSTRWRSWMQHGRWSRDISIAEPCRESTARQSPALATRRDLKREKQ
jgi:hypothetical protein